MIRRPPRSTLSSSSAASDVYKRQREHGRSSNHRPTTSRAPTRSRDPPTPTHASVSSNSSECTDHPGRALAIVRISSSCAHLEMSGRPASVGSPPTAAGVVHRVRVVPGNQHPRTVFAQRRHKVVIVTTPKDLDSSTKSAGERGMGVGDFASVSYTHLTLPTKRIV